MRSARELRIISTPAERRMWRLLFAFRTSGFHFRKQVPIGPYVVDMACHHARLVIEVDGQTHGSPSARRHDAERDGFLRSEGYAVLRFSNADVLHNPEGVFRIVAEILTDRTRNRRAGRPLPNPPHRGEGAGPAFVANEVPQTGLNTLPLVGRVGEGALRALPGEGE